MKRSPLRRKTPIARRDPKPAKARKRLPAKRATERRSSRVRDEAYLAWLRLQPCAVHAFCVSILRVPEIRKGAGIVVENLADAARCSGPTDPEHRREGVGMGQKASDRDAWPCCRKHHGDRHDGTGVFKGWTRASMSEFIRTQIAEANARYDAELAGEVPR